MGEALRKKKAADPKPLTCEGLAIINPYGGIWTPKDRKSTRLNSSH